MKTILKKIVLEQNEIKRLEYMEPLDELITNVNIANDECDYGMGLEFGINLFCYGESCFHEDILKILPIVYELLQRSRYASILKAHLKNRKKGAKLSTLTV